MSKDKACETHYVGFVSPDEEKVGIVPYNYKFTLNWMILD